MSQFWADRAEHIRAHIDSNAWSHDGRWLGYSSTRRNGADNDLYVIDPRNPKSDRLVAQVKGGGWAIIAGGLEIIAAIRLRKEIEGEWLLALSGLLSLLLGLFVLYLALANPHVSVAMLGWGIGFYALVTGVTLLILAMRLRRRVQSFKA